MNSTNHKYKKNDKFFTEAMNSLTSIFNNTNRIPEDEKLFLGDKIFYTCKCLEPFLGVKFIKPDNILNSDSGDIIIRKIAASSSLYCRKINLATGWYKKDSLSFLLILKNGSPAVAYIKKNKYIVFNPEHGKSFFIDDGSVLENLSESGYYFYKEIPVESADSLYKLIKSFFNKQYAKEVMAVILISSIGGLVSVAIPYLTGVLFDSVIPNSEDIVLLQIVCAIFMIKVTLIVFQFFRSIAFLRIQGKITAELQTSLINKLFNLPANFFRKYTVGDLTDRANGVDTISYIFSSFIVETLITGFFSLFNFLLLFYYSGKLALYSVLFTIVYLILVAASYYFIIKYKRRFFEVGGIVSGTCLQLIQGIKKIKITNSEMRFFSLWAKEYGAQRKESFAAGRILVFINSFSSGFSIFVNTGLFVLIFVSLRNFSQGEFIGFLTASGTFQASLVGMVLALASFFNIIPVYERLKPIIEAVPENFLKKNRVNDIYGKIEVRNLSFKYEGQRVNTLNNISLEIVPGSFVAIVGHSGCGKSTILRLLLGFEASYQGEIYFDDCNLSTLNAQSLRPKIGVVLQNDNLMGGSIFEILNRRNCSEPDMWEALKLACVDQEIKKMPLQLNTPVGESGCIISSGQKQRIMLARALLDNPSLLLLDEATSAVDNSTQSDIMKNIKELKATKIVVAHRISTVVNADIIYVMEKGSIVQKGRFEDLIKNSGVFQDIAKRQLL